MRGALSMAATTSRRRIAALPPSSNVGLLSVALAGRVPPTRDTSRCPARIRDGANIRILRDGEGARLSVKLPDQRGRNRLCGYRLVAEEVSRYPVDQARKIVGLVRRQSIFVAPVQSRHRGHREFGAAADEAATESVGWPRDYSAGEINGIEPRRGPAAVHIGQDLGRDQQSDAA